MQMVITKHLILLTYFFYECLCEPAVDLDSTKAYYVVLKEELSIPNTGDTEILNATLFKTIKSYYCRAQTDKADEELILLGTRAWTFPAQNVNLTLRYPSKNQQYEDKVDYVLTGLRVILHLSGPADSKGFITSGGMHQDHISMMFLLRNLTSLRYQFYLHGLPRRLLNRTENYTAELNLC